MSTPLVSIVMCCHNRRDYLRETLASVSAQSYPNIEMILVDDGSTDGTREMIEAEFSNTLTYHWQETSGIAVARTRASKLARGEYIAYQDDDDLMPPDRIKHLMRALLDHPQAVLATGDFALIDKDSNLTGDRWMPGPLDEVGGARIIENGRRAILWPEVPAVPHTTLFRRALGEQVDWFDAEFKYACSDADFLARLSSLGPIVYLREVVSKYRRGHAAIWQDNVRTCCSRIQLWDKHLRLLGDDDMALQNRLQDRMVQVLKILARNNWVDTQHIENVRDYYQLGKQHLDLKRKLALFVYAHVKAPLVRVVKRFGH